MIKRLFKGLFSAPAIVAPETIMPISRPFTRRSFLGGIIAVPAIIRVADLMPISVRGAEIPLLHPSGPGLFIQSPVTSEWIPVGLIDTIGEDSDLEIIPPSGAIKIKGARDAGTLAVNCFPKIDPGQIELAAAHASNERRKIAVVPPDNRETYLFAGVVSSHRRHLGPFDNVARDQFGIAFDSGLTVIERS
jgi:hypothetical protein